MYMFPWSCSHSRSRHVVGVLSIPSSSSSSITRHKAISFTAQRPILKGGLYVHGVSCCFRHHAVPRVVYSKKRRNPNIYSYSSSSSSMWEDEYEGLLSGGERRYREEKDVVTFIDPPNELIPLDPSSYNPAAYLWKKIEDVPEERRHRLLHLLQPRLISRAWGIAGTKYEDPNLAANKTASALLSDGDSPSSSFPEFWNCRTSGGPMPLSWMNSFKKAIFRNKDGTTCGRFLAGPIVGKLANSFAPLYFTVSQDKEIMSTEHPCDFAYHFGDGLSDIHDYPSGFPKPAKHPWPFNDQVVIYIRHLGPGVLVGQAWQEGEDLKKLPQKLCDEILMVKDYATLGDNQ